ncbi:MAG: hypothetical protein ABEJ61_01920 [Haloferacaceae archaeon]
MPDADPYLSHPVRRIREEPVPDESVALVVELADPADEGAVREAIADLGGRVTDDLRFADLRVELPQPAVDELCDRPGIARVETANAVGLGIHGDGP